MFMYHVQMEEQNFGWSQLCHYISIMVFRKSS